MAAVMYGDVIHDALRDPHVSIERLITLRDHARAILNQQGDLRGSLERLEREIERRHGEAGV